MTADEPCPICTQRTTPPVVRADQLCEPHRHAAERNAQPHAYAHEAAPKGIRVNDTDQPPTNRFAAPATILRRITLPSIALWTQGQARLLALGCTVEHAEILDQLQAERDRQDARWGGPEHDDQHDPSRWIHLISAYLELADDERVGKQRSPKGYRGRLLQVAALAVAAIESYDRKAADR